MLRHRLRRRRLWARSWRRRDTRGQADPRGQAGARGRAGARREPRRAARASGFDGLAITAAGLLVVLGVANLDAVSGRGAAVAQGVAAAFGLALLLLTRRYGARVLRTFGWVCYGASVAALVAVPVVGTTAFGARRWLSVGGFSFQPSELAKLGLLIVVALALASTRPSWWRLLLAALLAVPPIALTAMQPDLSTAALLTLLLVFLLTLSHVPARLLLPGLGAVLVAAPLAIGLLQPYQLSRIQEAFGGAESSYAIRQSHVAVASGELFGYDGDVPPDLLAQYLPNRDTDFALAALIERWGMVAGLLAVLAAVVLVWRLALAAAAPRSPAGSLVAGGLAALLGAEYAVNITGTLGLMPAAGMAFPLLGGGGTSAAVYLAAIGIALGVRRDGVARRLWSPPQLRFARPRLARSTAFGMSAVLVASAGYALHLQAAQGATLRAAGEEQVMRCTRVPAPRGIVTDRHGTPLATNTTVEGRSGPVPAREYPYGPLLGPLLGFVGVGTAAEAARIPGLPSGEFVGRSGIEQRYDALLRGVNGRDCVYVDPGGNTIGDAGTVAPVPGQDLRLSLDLGLQKKMSAALAAQVRRSGGDIGAAVAMDPRTGAVLAMASNPAYDNTLYGPPVDVRGLQRAASARGEPMLQHATAVTAPPGSVFKLVVAAANMVYGAIPPGEVIPTGASFTYGGNSFANWKPMGPQNLKQAIAMSNNVYFYKLGLKLGPEKMHKIGQQLGVGQPTGIDLPGESAGTFDSPATLEARGGTWYPGSTVIMGIGQGATSVTPLQVARWTAGITTGEMVTPQLGLATGTGRDGAEENDGRACTLPRSEPTTLPFAKKLGPVRDGMRAAAQTGTAAALSQLGVPAGGKTGSSQDPASPNGEPDSWFTAAAPLDDPSLVVTAFVRGGGQGSTTAGPVVAETLKHYLADTDAITATPPADDCVAKQK